MATFTVPITLVDTAGSTNLKVKYKISTDSIWTSYLIATSTSTSTSFTASNNRIYDVQVQNLNGADNPVSLILQGIGFTDPAPTITPTNTVAGYSFANLSADIDTYTVELTTTAAPGTIIATHTLSAGTYPNTVTDSFTGLTPSTAYRMIITPVANTFSESFVHTFATEAVATCGVPYDITVSITD